MKALAFLLLFAIQTPASAAGNVSVEIVEYGLYDAEAVRKEAAPATVSGELGVVADARHLETTQIVPGALGVHFGYRYKVTGAPGKPVRLRAVTVFPPGGLKNPKTGRTLAQDVYFTEREAGERAYRDYTFEYPWEIAPGWWEFQLWEGTTLVSKIRFKVVAGGPVS